MKKIIAILLSATVLMPVCAGAVMFNDTKGHWAETIIDELADEKIINGVGNGNFSPDSSVSRAQYLKMIMETMDIPMSIVVGNYLDVTGMDWYSAYLKGAMDKGLIPHEMITGYKSSIAADGKISFDGAFEGDKPITREEMAFLTMSMYQYKLNANTMKSIPAEAVNDFEDLSNISTWALSGVKLSAMMGFIEGDSNGYFNPKKNTTRAEAAAVISRVINKKQAEG